MKTNPISKIVEANNSIRPDNMSEFFETRRQIKNQIAPHAQATTRYKIQESEVERQATPSGRKKSRRTSPIRLTPSADKSANVISYCRPSHRLTFRSTFRYWNPNAYRTRKEKVQQNGNRNRTRTTASANQESKEIANQESVKFNRLTRISKPVP